MPKYVSHVLCIASLFLSTSAWSQIQGSSPSFKMSGDATLMTNYVQRGLTHSKKDPALLAAYRFNFGSQFRMGLSGSNVAYNDRDNHFNLKFLSDIKVVFSPNANLKINYTMDRYYKSSDRNGDILGLTLDTFGIRTHFQKFSNWEGTGAGGNWVAFSIEREAFSDWILELSAGFTQTKTSTFGDYFDASGTLKYKVDQLTWSAGLTGTSDQVGGRGGFFLVLAASAEF